MAEVTTQPKRIWLREERRWFLEILTLTAFVIAQPVLDVFGRSPETFFFMEAGRFDIVLFGIIVVLLPALGLWTLTVGFRILGPAGRGTAQDLVLWILLCVLGIQVTKRLTPLLNIPLALAGIGIGTLLLTVLLRARGARRWLEFGWPASVAFLGIFLLTSPVSKLILPQESAEIAHGEPGRASDTPVVFAIFDQFPLQTIVDDTGAINETLFPNIARLADGATWYRNFTVSESHTEFSIPTIITGQLVDHRERGQAVAANYPDNLFTLLSPTHRLEAYGSLGLCPYDPCSETEDEAAGDAPDPRVLRDLLHDAVGIWSDISLPRRVTRDIEAQFEEEVEPETAEDPGSPDEEEAPRRSRFSRFLDSIQPGSRPGLHYTHILLPHYPWQRLPTGKRYPRPDPDLPITESGVRTWFDLEWPVQLTRQRHLLQAQLVDRMIGRLIRRLERTDLYDDALIVITSDHGHSFIPGEPRAAPVEENMHDILWVPFIVKEPHQQEGRVDDKNLAAPDVLPTIADLLNIEIRWPTDGISALREEADRGPVKTYLRRHDPPRIPWPDTTLSLPIDEAWDRLRRRAYAPADPSADPELLPYLVGPGGHLVGRSIEDMQIGTPYPLSATLDSDEDFAVPATGRMVPALVAGTLPGAAEGTLVAVAVNGRIGGVSTIFDLHGRQDLFMVLAPDFFFEEGPNLVDLFILEGNLLRPISLGSAGR